MPIRVPGPGELPRRLGGVLAVVHLVLTAGHTAPTGAGPVRHDLLDRAHDLARLLRSRFPDDADVAGLLALVLLTDARRATRVDADGALVLLADQDRSRWDAAMIDEGRALVRGALTARPVRRYAVLAEVADEPRLAGYGYLAAARGELLRRAGRHREAREAIEEAVLLTGNDVERELLAGRPAALG